jgi:4-alpha-glucanotransferase
VTARIALALAIHNHQPVGNFGSVIAFNHERAYEPLLAALEAHPRVSMALHYSGPLLEWLQAERPAFVERLAALSARGQVEIMGGGYFEPVLPALPERDRLGQLTRMRAELERLFGQAPRGAWLAERVWEPDLPTSLAGAGYGWTILDDAHFRAAAVPEDGLWGAYTTDDQGARLTLFATEQGLRYRIPFGHVEDVIAYLREQASEDGRRLGVMGDDGEKFGAWPTTWEHCWGTSGWVERFFRALEANTAWLTTLTPSLWLEREPPVGRVYVPTGSYAEMGEWALPPEEALRYGQVLHADLATGRPETRWLRGGFWRNFQVKYREINDLHKQMLRTSAAVDAMAPGLARTRALDHLYQGQSNDCYWHGLFGGVYLSHMRLATFGHLIAAEDAADTAARATGARVDGASLEDVDLDGRDEVLVRSPGQVVVIKPDAGAGIGAWDVRAARHALAAVLRRRPEAYHTRLRAPEATLDAPAAEARAASIHDLERGVDPSLAGRLHYDTYERRSGLVHLLPDADSREAVALEAYATAAFAELGDFADQPFELRELGPQRIVCTRQGRIAAAAGPRPLTITKTVRIAGSRAAPRLALDVQAHNPGPAPLVACLAVEWSLTLLGGGANPAAWYEVGGVRSAHDGSGSAKGVVTLRAGNDDLGLILATTLEPAADAWWYSIDTVSLSEDGLQLTHQGSCLSFLWPLRLAPGESATFVTEHHISAAIDRAEVESG